VSGRYFAHPESRYVSLSKIDRDQVTDYSKRKGMSVAEVERWLGAKPELRPCGIASGSPVQPQPFPRLCRQNPQSFDTAKK
jgi:hypothetical protein